ncbi:hypothetical protein FRC04_005223 [Tulasnella sp. 424]|nr:hypothetical protein FRC04_005223 [Tulasnella sp. 424]
MTLVTTRAKVLIELKKHEDESLSSMLADDDEAIRPAVSHSGAMFLSNAMDIEDLQYQLRTRNLEEYIAEGTTGTDKRRAQHMKSMDALRRRIEEHFEALLVVAPGLNGVSLGRAQVPSSQDLYLPSSESFTRAQREAYGLKALGDQEAALRIGNAHDYLSGLKDALGLCSLLIQVKKTHIRGQIKTTRSEASIARAGKVVQRQEAGYRRNWKAMVALGVRTSPGQPGHGLQELRDEDVQGLRNIIENREYSGNPAQLPWIWRSFGDSTSSTASASEVQRSIESWEQEVLRLTWLHVQTSRDRWREEHVLLQAELERVASTFEHGAKEWMAIQLLADLDDKALRGIRAYGQRKASMFAQLAKEANVYFAVIESHWNGALKQGATSAELDDESEQIAGAPIVFEETDDIY